MQDSPYHNKAGSPFSQRRSLPTADADSDSCPNSFQLREVNSNQHRPGLSPLEAQQDRQDVIERYLENCHTKTRRTYNPDKHQTFAQIPRSSRGTSNSAVIAGPHPWELSGELLDLQSLALLSLHDPYRPVHSHLEEPDNMDEAFRQHADPSRRRNRSASNLAHLTLAPITSRLPSHEQPFDSQQQYLSASRSYLDGKSAPTTPALLGRSHATRPRIPIHPSATAAASLPTKSLSATALHCMSGTSSSPPSYSKHRQGGSGTHTPTRHHHHTLAMTEAVPNRPAATERDWLEHTGALLSDSAREYKGQTWLVSRDSSTSLTAQGHEHEQEGQWDVLKPLDQSRTSSPSNSRVGSRRGSRITTPLERSVEGGHFSGLNQGSQEEHLDDEWADGPDFVNPEKALDVRAQVQPNLEEDEAAINNLVRTGDPGMGGWFGGLVGWSLFGVEEGDEIVTDEYLDYNYGSRLGNRTGSAVRFADLDGGASATPAAVQDWIPPPDKSSGVWQDAAWLLCVASKLIV